MMESILVYDGKLSINVYDGKVSRFRMEKCPIYGGKYPGLKWKSIQIYNGKVSRFMMEKYPGSG